MPQPVGKDSAGRDLYLGKNNATMFIDARNRWQNVTGGMAPKPHHPLFNEPRFDRVTQDRFFFCIEARDPKFDRGKTWNFLESTKPEGVYAVHDLPW